jgi:hypothetical protein
MARFCILALLIGHLHCARIDKVGDDSSNDFASLGEVNASMESAGFQHQHRYLLKSVRSGRYLHVRSENGRNGDPLFTVQSTTDGSKWTANTRQFGGVVTLTSVRSGNKLHVRSQDTRSGGRVAHVDSTSEGSRWQVERAGNRNGHEVVRLRSSRTHDYLHVDSHHQGDRDHVIHFQSTSSGSEWEVIPVGGGGGGGSGSAAESRLRAVGRWKGLRRVASGGTDMSVSTGTTQSNTRGSSSSFSSQVSVAVSAGFDCLGAHVDTSVTASVGSDMSRSSEFSTSSSREETVTEHFEATDGASYLWQWVFDYNRNGQLQGTTHTLNFAQTAGAWEPPACLPGYHTDPYEGAQHCARDRFRIRYNN